MNKVIERIVTGPGAPDTNDLWLDTKEGESKLKVFNNGEWKELKGAGVSKTIGVSDITSLTAIQLDALKCGDVIVKGSNGHEHAYVVAYKDEDKGELSLVYTDHENIEEVYYEKTEGEWAFVVKQIANQDYLFVDVLDGLEDLSSEEKAKIRDLHDRGLLFDAVIRVQGFQLLRVIADTIDLDDTIVVWNAGAAEVEAISVALE